MEKIPVGNSNYYKTVVNLQSDYVYWTGHNSGTHSSATSDVTHATSAGSPFSQPSSPINSSLVVQTEEPQLLLRDMVHGIHTLQMQSQWISVS